MNSNLNRALAAALVVFGGVAPALAQIDSDSICIDPANTKPYSDDFNFGLKLNKFFGASVGVAGTVAYTNTPYCEGGGPIRGRIGFTLGTEGSIQDNLHPYTNPITGEVLHDDNLRLTKGTNFLQEPLFSPNNLGAYGSPALGGTSYARVYVQHTTTAGAVTTDNFLFGINPITLSFEGRGGRYIYVETPVAGTATNNSVNVRLITDVLGDTARLNWRLTNNLQTTDTIGLGLYFGQVVQLLEESAPFPRYVTYGTGASAFPTVYMTIPGRRPLSVDERFPDPDPDPLTRSSTSVPPYINFSLNQALGYGLQVVNSPTVLTAIDPTSGTDQTPVDEFTIGQWPFVVDGHFNTTDPVFNDFIFNAPGNGNDDAAPLVGDPAYLQKWLPTVTVGPGAARVITSYYRSTNFDSSYSPQFSGYTANVDTPKSIPTDPTSINGASPFQDLNGSQPGDFTIRVNVDNTGGFTNPDKQVTMSSVDVVMHLPAGMSDPSDGSRTITKSIGRISPTDIQFVDFQVKVDPNLFGAQTYSVDITPNPGFRRKTITGTINVATSPRLLIRSGPNLVSPPWEFSDPSWESVLGLALNSQFQSYKWDARQQKYVTQLNAERAVGTWIVSPSDLNYRALGGTPRQPRDEFPDPANYDVSASGTSPTVPLYAGWNLIGNPYNYAFPLGQIIGIPRGGQANNRSLSFDQLVGGQFTNGSFSYFDSTTGEYRSIAGRASSRLQPNYGYWIFVNQDMDLQFPPIYELFIRSAEPAEAPQRFDNWKLQLSAATVNSRDTQNFVGIVRNPADVPTLSIRKAPMPPAAVSKSTVYSYVTGDAGYGMATSLRRASSAAQTFKYNVFTQTRGPVTVSWPNLRSIPSNLQVSITDNLTRKTIDARRLAGYTFNATGTGVRAFTVKVTPAGIARQRIGSPSYSLLRMGSIRNARIGFTTTARGSATIEVYRGVQRVADVATDMDVVAGANSVLWPLTDLDGQPLPNGTYTLRITATGDGGDTARYQGTIAIRR